MIGRGRDELTGVLLRAPAAWGMWQVSSGIGRSGGIIPSGRGGWTSRRGRGFGCEKRLEPVGDGDRPLRLRVPAGVTGLAGGDRLTGLRLSDVVVEDERRTLPLADPASDSQEIVEPRRLDVSDRRVHHGQVDL